MISQDDQKLKPFFKDLLMFMRASSVSFDNGYIGEAHRLAVCVRAIVQDTGKVPSILRQLRVQDTIYFYDNCPEYNPALNLPFSGLAIPIVGARDVSYIPRLGRNPGVKFRKVFFDEWWNKPVIVDSSKGLGLSREGIIISVSNTYADSLDRTLHKEYNRLILENSLDWVEEGECVEKDETMMQMEFASSRHIAFELLKSLEEQVPELLQLPS